MIGAPFLCAARAPWSACPTWKTDTMLENRVLKNAKSISNVLHLGLALLVFLGKIFRILAFLGSRRKAGFFLRTAPHTERRQRRVRPVWGCFPQAAPVCTPRLLPNPHSTTSGPFLISTRELLLACSIFLNPSSSSAPLLHLAHGLNSPLPVQPPVQPCHCTRPSCPKHHSRPTGGCGHPLCFLVLEGVIILPRSITSRACLVWETEHNPRFSPNQSGLCFHHIPSFSDSVTAKLPFEMQRDSLILPSLRQGSLYWLANPGIS